jgi:hypothetical protein
MQCAEMKHMLSILLALATSAAAIWADAPTDRTHAFTSLTLIDRSARGTHSRPPIHLHAENATRRRLPVMIPVDARRHEHMLVELMSAILQTDDITLLERDAQTMGVAYLDTNFSMCRPPLLLRQSVRQIMQRYDLSIAPLERKWTPVPGNHTLSRHPPPGFLDE